MVIHACNAKFQKEFQVQKKKALLLYILEYSLVEELFTFFFACLFNSRWYLSAQESLCVLLPVSQRFERKKFEKSV